MLKWIRAARLSSIAARASGAEMPPAEIADAVCIVAAKEKGGLDSWIPRLKP